MKRKKKGLLDWAACSPDCNPVENIWGILVRRVHEKDKQYQTVQQLKTSIERAWLALEQEILDNLVGSMPNRIFRLIKANGGPIPFWLLCVPFFAGHFSSFCSINV